jgi:hypothetical protein
VCRQSAELPAPVTLFGIIDRTLRAADIWAALHFIGNPNGREAETA